MPWMRCIHFLLFSQHLGFFRCAKKGSKQFSPRNYRKGRIVETREMNKKRNEIRKKKLFGYAFVFSMCAQYLPSHISRISIKPTKNFEMWKKNKMQNFETATTQSSGARNMIQLLQIFIYFMATHRYIKHFVIFRISRMSCIVKTPENEKREKKQMQSIHETPHFAERTESEARTLATIKKCASILLPAICRR